MTAQAPTPRANPGTYARGRWTCRLCEERGAVTWAEVPAVSVVVPHPAVLSLEELEARRRSAWGERITLRPWCAVRACAVCEEVSRRWGLGDMGAAWLRTEAAGLIAAMDAHGRERRGR